MIDVTPLPIDQKVFSADIMIVTPHYTKIFCIPLTMSVELCDQLFGVDTLEEYKVHVVTETPVR